MLKKYSCKFGTEELVFETGELAPQAGGAISVRLGDSFVLVTATGSTQPREGVDFFPLTVDVDERRYAYGKIPGSFFRREGRNSTDGTLLCRLVDRPLRPLFPQGYRNEVQIVITPLSVDEDHAVDIMAVNGASCALMISDVPFDGPIGAVRIGYIDGEYIVNPTVPQIALSDLDLRVAGTKESVLMIEAGANEFPEDKMVEAIALGHRSIQDVIALQEQMAAEIGKSKIEYTPHIVDEDVLTSVRAKVEDALREVIYSDLDREARQERENQVKKELFDSLDENIDTKQVAEAFDSIFKSLMRNRILDDGFRVDGRAPDEVRPLSAQVGLLPRTHGSGLFNRGLTQVLNVTTLGSSKEALSVEGLNGDMSKVYFHHYNFPPYSTGETYPIRGPRRRSIGHGALAERAIEPVLPSFDEFPYVIRTVSECLSSNGSTSMASTCASTLSLLDAGVPLKAPVAGIAMGVITEGDRYCVLTDIQGLEDHLGDMDFKVTGTEAGITAMQLDCKISGLLPIIIEETLAGARKARMQILDVINACIPAPRSELSPYAPRIQMVKIPVDKIGALIGPGGKNIRSIIEDTGVTIDVDEDGTVRVGSTDGPSAIEAIRRIEGLTAVPELGRVYTGKVTRIQPFGAFVQIMPGQEGLVHISQLADYRVNSVEDVVQEGDEIMVMVTGVDSGGKIRLSRQAVLAGWTLEEAQSHDRPPSGGSRGGGRSRDGGDRRRRD